MTDQREIVLVNMPFAQVCWPNLGLGLLQAGVKRRGFPCRTLYLNFWLAEQIGYSAYSWIAENFAFAMGGERLFAAAYFGQVPTDPAAYHAEVLSADPDFSPEDARQYARLFQEIDPFLDAALAAYSHGENPSHCQRTRGTASLHCHTVHNLANNIRYRTGDSILLPTCKAVV